MAQATTKPAAKQEQAIKEEQAKALATQQPGSIALPPMDAPAVSANNPTRSYKIAFADKENWHISEDQGQTTSCSNVAQVGGVPLDFCIVVSEASYKDGLDHRFRLAFTEPDGTLSELHLNAASESRDGNLYVPSPVRSLLGGLMVISESEDDMAAFATGARFRLKPGRPGKNQGVFIELDIPSGGKWVTVSSPGATQEILRDVRGFHGQVALVKSRFRGCGLMLTSAAITGAVSALEEELDDEPITVVPVDASAVPDDNLIPF